MVIILKTCLTFKKYFIFKKLQVIVEDDSAFASIQGDAIISSSETSSSHNEPDLKEDHIVDLKNLHKLYIVDFDSAEDVILFNNLSH